MDVEVKTLEGLLTEKSLSLPVYQREYTWKAEREVKDLIEDVRVCLETHDEQLANHFMGTVLLDPKSEDDEEADAFDIVDGQQRLTSLTIFLVALRNHFKNELKDNETSERIQQLVAPSPTGHTRDLRQTLHPAPNISDAYRQMLSPLWEPPFETNVARADASFGIKRQVNRVKPVYDRFAEFITELTGDEGTASPHDLLRQLLENTRFIEIRLEESSQASEIFERTNDRGRSLSIADLVKNHLHSRKDEAPGINVETKWDTIIARAGQAEKQMLRFFMVSREGSVSTRELYRRIKAYSYKKGLEHFVEELDDFSQFFASYRQGHDHFAKWLSLRGIQLDSVDDRSLQRSHLALERFGITQPIPLIFSSVRAIMDEELDVPSNTLPKLLRALESYHFINNKVANRVGNDVEKLYQRTCEDIWANKTDVLNKLEGLRRQLERKLASYKEYDATLTSYRIEKASSGMKAFVIVAATMYDDYKAGRVSVFGGNTDLEATQLVLCRIGKPKDTTETLSSELPYLVCVPSDVKSYLERDPEQTLSRLNDRLQQQRVNEEGILLSQFRSSFDILPTDGRKASSRFKQMSKHSYEQLAESIRAVSF